MEAAEAASDSLGKGRETVTLKPRGSPSDNVRSKGDPVRHGPGSPGLHSFVQQHLCGTRWACDLRSAWGREGPTTAPRGRGGEDIQTPAHVDGALSLPRLKSNDKDTERRGDKHKTWKGQRAGCDRQARFLEPVGLRQKAQCGPRGCGGPLPARARVSCHGPPSVTLPGVPLF